MAKKYSTKGKGPQGKVGKDKAIAASMIKKKEYNERAKELGKRFSTEGRQRLKHWLLKEEGFDLTLAEYKRLEILQNRIGNFLQGRGGVVCLSLGILEKAQEIDAKLYKEKTIDKKA